MRRQQLRPRAPPRLLRAAAATTAQPCALPRPVSFVWRRRRQLSRAPYPALSPSCSSGDDSSAARPASPRHLRVATTTTAQPRAPPCLVSFVGQGRRLLSRAPRPAPSPSCGDDDDSSAVRPAPSPSCGEDDDSSAARPAWPRLLRVATTTTAQPRALPSCSGSDDSSGRAPHPVSFVQRRRRQLRPCAPPRLLRAAAATTTQPRALPRPVSFVQRRRRQLSRAPYTAQSPSRRTADDSPA